MSSVCKGLNKDKLTRDEFWQLVKDAETFDDLILLLNYYRGVHDNRIFQILFKKCMGFVGNGFALNEDLALWRKVLGAIAHDGGILFVFQNGLMIEFKQGNGGRVRMHVFMAGEGDA
jgi:hypothetical protein